MRHVKPHRWADALAGRIGSAERAKMDSHAETCGKCSRARARISTASDSFPAIREQSGPELPWDSVRARVHWSVSKAKREEQEPRPPLRIGVALAWTAAIAGAAIGIAVLGGGGVGRPVADSAPIATGMPPAPAKTIPSRDVAPAPAKASPKALAGLVNRLSAGELMIDGKKPADLFAQRIVAGTVIATGDARVDVQFGTASAFALGPHSTLDVHRFDADMIELAVDGTIDIEVAPRAAGQRFVVLAGDHAIEVRGTQFRVSHQGSATTVACRHGLVAVHDRATSGDANTALVGAARRVSVAAGAKVAEARVEALSVEELTSLADATPMTLPLWDPDALPTTSAPLEIGGAGKGEVRVDGIELGVAPLRVRVMPGRHTVEATDSAGRYRRAGWVDVAAPSVGGKPARLDIAPEVSPTAGVNERKRQLRAGIDRARLSRCTRSIAKAGLTGTFVQVELSVDPSGAVGFLNVIDTDLPSSVASCVREVLADVRFQGGAAATWREKIDL